MSEEDIGDIHSFSGGGVTGTHPSVSTLPMMIAPSTTGEFNVVRFPLIPIACCSLFDTRFEFDSSVVRPETAQEMGDLAGLLKTHPGAILSLFGHADTVGQDAYNKQLSGRRSEAVYAMLTRNTAQWERLYAGMPSGGDQWGLKAIQIMLDALLFDPGRTDGVLDDATRASVKRFQAQQGLSADGDPGPRTRAKLFAVYMDLVCVDENGKSFRLRKEDFLGRGADPGGKGDYQGCSDFNPLLIFSQADHEKFTRATDKRARNAANAPNRRVLVFLFAPNTRVDVAKWPCPRVSEGVEGCHARFFSDTAKRRSFQQGERRYENTRDTFACRFYDRLAIDSPCERILPVLRIRLFDFLGNVLIGAPFLAKTPNKSVRGHSDGEGDAVIFDVPIPSTCNIQWRRPNLAETTSPPPASVDISSNPETADESELTEEAATLLFAAQDNERELRVRAAENVPGEFEFALDVFVDLTEAEHSTAAAMTEEAARRRLNNLGYAAGTTLEDNLRAFQRDCDLPQTGQLADAQDELKRRHDDCDPPSPLKNEV